MDTVICTKCNKKLKPKNVIVKKAFPDNFNDMKQLKSGCCDARVRVEE